MENNEKAYYEKVDIDNELKSDIYIDNCSLLQMDNHL